MRQARRARGCGRRLAHRGPVRKIVVGAMLTGTRTQTQTVSRTTVRVKPYTRGGVRERAPPSAPRAGALPTPPAITRSTCATTKSQRDGWRPRACKQPSHLIETCVHGLLHRIHAPRQVSNCVTILPCSFFPGCLVPIGTIQGRPRSCMVSLPSTSELLDAFQLSLQLRVLLTQRFGDLLLDVDEGRLRHRLHCSRSSHGPGAARVLSARSPLRFCKNATQSSRSLR